MRLGSISSRCSGKEQEVAFNELKKRLAKTDTLRYFDSAAKTRVITDASPVGLGAILVQEQNGEERVICYVSRSLTDVEKRYSQTEKEVLGIVWECERLHMSLYGTDHKPLHYSKKSQPSARVSRWVSRLPIVLLLDTYLGKRTLQILCLVLQEAKQVQTLVLRQKSMSDSLQRIQLHKPCPPERSSVPQMQTMNCQT